MAISGIITVMERAARKAGTKLRRDFGEIEHLQVSQKGPADFVSKADQAAERLGQILAVHDHVDHPVIEQIFGALEPLGKLLTNRVLDHALSGKADQRIGLADLNVAEHRIAGGDAACRRICEQHHIRKTRAAQAL